MKHAVEVRKGYMPFTKSALRAEKRMQVGGSGSSSSKGAGPSMMMRPNREKLVQQLDPDASVRGPGAWDMEDMHYEKALIRSLFELSLIHI